jgi:hypothetical protein
MFVFALDTTTPWVPELRSTLNEIGQLLSITMYILEKEKTCSKPVF